MNCPQCHGTTKVIDTRPENDGLGVRRRRECEDNNCGLRFSSVERGELYALSVEKHDKENEAYDENKLRHSLKAVLSDYREASYIDEILSSVKASIIKASQEPRLRLIKSSDIMLHVMGVLQRLEPIAYVRYTSWYRKFDDVGPRDPKPVKRSKRSKNTSTETDDNTPTLFDQ